MIDLRSWPKKWNDASLRQIATLPENATSRPWPMFGMFAFGVAVGAALGGYAVSQRSTLKRLATHAHRGADELAGIATGEDVEPNVVVTTRTNHRRKTALEV
jgi:hypothetical protein